MPSGQKQKQDARHEHGAFGSRHSSSEFEQDYRQHEQSLASEIGNAVRRAIGKIKRVVRNPEKASEQSEATINSQEPGPDGKIDRS